MTYTELRQGECRQMLLYLSLSYPPTCLFQVPRPGLGSLPALPRSLLPEAQLYGTTFPIRFSSSPGTMGRSPGTVR